MFNYHKLVQENDGIIIELYLDRQWEEFAKDFDGRNPNQAETLENAVLQYIREKLPNIRVKAIKIMLGSILVAVLPYSHVYASDSIGVTSTAQIQSISVTAYTVKKGDTLFQIAQSFGTTTEKLKIVNGLRGQTIYAGQQLILPGRNNDIYVVQAGDSLYSISRRFSTTVDTIKSANGLKDDSIFIGQWIRIAANRQQAHVVKYGDTLYNISKHYNVPIEWLMAVNGLKGDDIFSGQNLLIPIPPSKFITLNKDSKIALVNKNHILTSDYIPYDMVVPRVSFTSKEYNNKKLMRKEAALALEALFERAKEQGINLFAISGYRSYQRQEEIFAQNIIKYGSTSAANRFSAKPGESEHQTGLAMDVTASSVNYTISQAFGETLEGKWLRENASDYGFIIRYPKGMESITGYQYEPWHIRYVGLDAAKAIDDRAITLEQYLGKY